MKCICCIVFASEIGPAQGPPPPPGGQVNPNANDLIKGSAYSEQWFMMYIKGKLIALDPVDFVPHKQYALDGFPLYGIAEIDGSAARAETAIHFRTSIITTRPGHTLT